MTGRAVKEWIGKTPDTAVPPRVRRRVFDAYNGRCYLTLREILPGDLWELEHIKSLKNGGENRESNLAPALVAPHKLKTAKERKLGARADNGRNKHIGIKRKPKWRPMAGTKASGIRKRMSGNVERWT